jgi:hypothetical protein
MYARALNPCRPSTTSEQAMACKTRERQPGLRSEKRQGQAHRARIPAQHADSTGRRCTRQQTNKPGAAAPRQQSTKGRAVLRSSNQVRLARACDNTTCRARGAAGRAPKQKNQLTAKAGSPQAQAASQEGCSTAGKSAGPSGKRAPAAAQRKGRKRAPGGAVTCQTTTTKVWRES